MTDEPLKRLYDRVIRQEVYEGDVCPAEHVLADYATGGLIDRQRALLEVHLQSCPACREDLAALEKGLAWFESHREHVLAGIAERGAQMGTEPWVFCPATGVLLRYCEGAIAQSDEGRALAERISRHIKNCADCRRKAQLWAQRSAAPIFSLDDLAGRIDQALRSRLRAFFGGLLATSQTEGVPLLIPVAAGRREGEPVRIVAPLVDKDGRVVVSESGVPEQCEFHVLAAAIASDGFLKVDLSASDRRYHRHDDVAFAAGLVIRMDDLQLAMPRSAIDAGGRVTFSGMVPEAVAVDPLPVSALDVTVQRMSADGV